MTMPVTISFKITECLFCPLAVSRYLHEKHDVMVFKKRVSRSPITVYEYRVLPTHSPAPQLVYKIMVTILSCSFMGRGVLDVPLQDLAEFVKGVENNMAWDDLLIVRLKNCIP